ncbi:MAG: accessory factor UbiK family protein [Hyphomicrobium sp.]
MTQTNNRFFDELGKFMTDAAGVAEGVQRETETFLRLQAEKILGNMELVRREEFEAVKIMAQRAREDTETLAARITVLEEEIRLLKSKV